MRVLVSKSGKRHDIPSIRLNCQLEGARGCWIWKGSVNKDGQPILSLIPAVSQKKVTILIQRYVWTLYTQKLPDRGESVRPTCGHDLCCNPDHLDCQKRTWTVERVSKSARLTDAEVVAYRKRFMMEEIDTKGICKETGLSQSAVYNFLRGKTYKRDLSYRDDCVALLHTKKKSVFSDEDVCLMRKRYHSGLLSFETILTQTGAHTNTVQDMLQGASYAKAGGPKRKTHTRRQAMDAIRTMTFEEAQKTFGVSHAFYNRTRKTP